MKFSVVIPARYQSTRLPRKPLLDICGKPMIQHVYEAALKSDAERVIIATDNEEIAQVAEKFSAEVCMTAVSHVSGTDRLQEVASKLAFRDDEIVVNVQGDEPLIPPALINQVARNLSEQVWASIATLYEPIAKLEDLFNPNQVKLVANHAGEVLYFSRAPIPWAREGIARSADFSFKPDDALLDAYPFKRHIGIYAYRCVLLHQFVSWQEAPLEQVEKLEQLRAMYYGHRIHVAKACQASAQGVDTPQDLELVRKMMSHT